MEWNKAMNQLLQTTAYNGGISVNVSCVCVRVCGKGTGARCWPDSIVTTSGG